MRILILLTSCILIIAGGACKSTAVPTATGKMLTGKLVISELCNHYVVSVLSGSLPSTAVTASYRDEKRNLTYTNVFTVESKCSFEKAGIKEGEQFSFELATAGYQENCMVCMAYYPTPATRLSIVNIKKINP